MKQRVWYLGPVILAGIAFVISACIRRTAPAPTISANTGRDYFTWDVRAAHTDEPVLAVGDSLDIALLRYRNRTVGIFEDHNIRPNVRWESWDIAGLSPLLAVAALAEGRWRLGPTVAGARIRALGAGRTQVAAIIDDNFVAAAGITIVSAPGAVRVTIQPTIDTVGINDTLLVRAVALDGQGAIVGILPPPVEWTVVAPPNDSGYARVIFPYKSMKQVRLTARLGALTHTMVMMVREP